jgi:Tfp pilus assembly protein PilX
MFRRIQHEERGIALITALMIVFVLAALGLTVVQLSLHNSDASNLDRKRVQSVNAAEAGVDYTWNALEQTAPQTLPWNGTTKTGSYAGTLGTGPGTATFTSTVQYLDANQTALTSQPSQSNIPAYALITSRGTTNGSTARTLQAFVKLNPIRQGIQSAVLINSGATFSNNFTVNGDQGNDGDIHIENGDLTIQNQPNIYGNVYVSNGTLTVKNNNTIHGNAWAWSTVDIQNPGAILGYARSSSADIKGSGSIGGDATAGTTIANTLTVSGSSYPTSPTTTHPPAITFPYVCWNTTGTCVGASTEYSTQDVKNNSTNEGSVSSPNPDGTPDWTIVTKTDCTSARAFLLGATITADTVLRVTGCADLQISNNESVTFDRNLVIFSDGSITLINQNNWNGQNNNMLGFFVNYQGLATPCSTNVTTSNNSNFNNVYVSFYSACTITIQNQNSFSGQVLGQAVNLANNFTLNYKPVLLPGIGRVIGFQQDVVFEREIIG